MLQPGSHLGPYEIRSLLGAGGMGEVYLAHDPRLRRPVALKVLSEPVRRDAELRAHLEHEARSASALNHPNILTVYDVGSVGEVSFIATEYVDGLTLRQKMNGPAPKLRDVIDIMIQVASALAAAEGAGLVHRDIKPDNIMVRRDGWVKLLDFGLARNGAGETDSARVSENLVRGTVFYMSPEQLRGMTVDGRSDLWSAGVVLFELITGQLPFEGVNAADIARAILHAEPRGLAMPDGSPVPPRIAAIINTAMTRERSSRYQHAADLLSDLQRLRADLESDASSIVGTSEARQATTEQVAIEEPPPNNLPPQLTALVGRDGERDDVLSLLRRPDVRMVTLTGPGGTGKTRLGLAVATELLQEMDDGVWWVPLESVRDPRLVLPEIAAALEVNEGSTALPDAIRSAIGTKKLLIVLDNFEQVLEAAPLIGELLRAGPAVKALATSRSPLHVAGEREYAVPPLATPPPGVPAEVPVLAAYPSVALFVERACAARSDFTLNSRNAQTIAELCRRLDGLPLAIELAAARVKILPPAAMLSRIEKRLKLLAGGSRDLPQRQQTMRAAISWGYNLLGDDDRRLFATLSVFRGGFDIETAERLCGAACEHIAARGANVGEPPDVLEGIASLLDKAFLRRDPESPEDAPRFAMLETIREYGLECLAEQAFDADVRASHAHLMAAIAEENEGDSERLAEDEDNFRTAIDWACSEGDAVLALRFGAALWWHWYLHGQYSEGRRTLDAMLALPGAQNEAVRARAATGAGALAFLQCDYERAIALLEESIDLARAHGDTVSLARALQFRGSIARERCEYDHAVDLHHLSRTLWLDLGDEINAGRSLNYIAFASWLSGDFARTFELCEKTLTLFRERLDTEGVAWSLLNLAAASHYTGDGARAEAHLEECLSWSRTGGFKEGIAWSLNLFGLLLRARGDLQQAEHFLQDSLQLDWELGDRWRVASMLEALGGIRRDARLIAAAAALRERLGTPTPPAERPQLEADLAAVGELPRWDRSTDEAVRLALG